jgi:hypothetical protein
MICSPMPGQEQVLSSRSIGVQGNPIECAQDVAPFFVDLAGTDGVLGLSNAYNDSVSLNFSERNS